MNDRDPLPQSVENCARDIVDASVVVEVKAMDAILQVHKAQVLTYLRLTKLRLGLLINFNVPLIKDGIKRMIL